MLSGVATRRRASVARRYALRVTKRWGVLLVIAAATAFSVAAAAWLAPHDRDGPPESVASTEAAPSVEPVRPPVTAPATAPVPPPAGPPRNFVVVEEDGGKPLAGARLVLRERDLPGDLAE